MLGRYRQGGSAGRSDRIGERAEDSTFVAGQYVRIGVLDAVDNDKANFSRSEQTFTSCNGENPTLEVLEGTGFVVKEDV